jgi:hypothetical protein
LAHFAWISAALLLLDIEGVALPRAVIVELQPHDNAAAEAIVASCNAALGGSPCRVAVASDAALQLRGSATHVHVRVALSSPAVERARLEFFLDEGFREQRELALGASDPLPERHRAIGLVIAARVLERADERARVLEATRAEQAWREQAEQQERSERQREAARVAQQERTRRLAEQDAISVRLDLAGLAGPGLNSGPVRVGGMARASLQLSESVPIAVLIALRLAMRAGEPSVRWTTPSLGLLGKIALGKSDVALELRVEGLIQRIDAQAEDRATGMHEQGHASRYGGAAGLEAIFEIAEHFALFVGGETSLLWPRFVLEVQGRQAGAEGASHVQALAGMRLKLH